VGPLVVGEDRPCPDALDDGQEATLGDVLAADGGLVEVGDEELIG